MGVAAGCNDFRGPSGEEIPEHLSPVGEERQLADAAPRGAQIARRQAGRVLPFDADPGLEMRIRERRNIRHEHEDGQASRGYPHLCCAPPHLKSQRRLLAAVGLH